jgi:hypothetical protein
MALALCSSAAFSCAKGTGGPPPPMSAESQDLSVTLHERMAAVAEQDRGHCMKLATDLRAVIEAVRAHA